MSTEPVRVAETIRLGEEFELDLRAYELRRSGRPLKLERIPMELLLFLVRQSGQLVTRDQIVTHIWGKDVYLDADNSINAAIRKIRQVLRDDPEHPRFIQTITGRGYRLIATVVSNTTESSPTREVVSSQSSSPESLIGKKLSHYRILQLLGGGGMGVVYKAEDLKLGRSVAIKLLPAEVGLTSQSLSRMYHEARAASALEHPNICPVYELEEHQDQPFIVMPLLEGQTLREWISQATDQASPSCLNQLVSIGIQVCRGLEAAHEKGILHRDIKPANIFVTKRGEVKILDFGVAKFLHAGSISSEAKEGAATAGPGAPQETKPPAEGIPFTQTADSVGTPSYLSPEQVRREELDTRTDLFSFGLVLYEMATGERAFSGNTVTEIQNAVLRLPAAPPRELRPGLPLGLEAIITRAIEKERGLRYQTADEMRADLESVAAYLSVSIASAKPDLAAPQTARARTQNRHLVLAGSILFFLVALVVGGLYYRAYQAKHLSEKDTIVIADFANSTGDPIFDDTLKQALNVALRQSPFLNILSDDKIASNLKLMTRPPNSALTADVAREVCQRSDSKAYVEGAIAALGNEYVIGLKGVNCQTGDVLAREQVTASSKEKVIAVLGDAANKMRSELGESLASVQQFDVPLEQATTASLDALKAYSLAYHESNSGAYLAAIPLYQQAVTKDPQFAVAYAHMGQAYANSGQDDLAVKSINSAFDLRQRASELERFYIDTRYYELVTGDVDKRIEVLQLWKRMYPRDSVPPNDLAAEYTDMGKYDQALAEAQDEVRLAPNDHTGYELLGISYLGLNRFDEAEAVRQKSIAHKIDYHWDHIDLYGIAFQKHDSAGMQRELEWARGNKYEFLMLRAAAGDLASIGKLREARDVFRQAMEKAQSAGMTDAVKSTSVDLALTETMLGYPVNTTEHLVAEAGNNRNSIINAGRYYALVGNLKAANTVADNLLKQSALDTYMNNVWVPSIRAEVEINRGHPAKALEILAPSAPYDFGQKAEFWPNYARGRAYLHAGKGAEASAEFQKILGHRGVCFAGFLSPLVYSLSQLELARSKVIAGDSAGARAAYQALLVVWKDADPDIPVLKQAKAELAKLN